MCRCSISWACRKFLAANGNTWMNCSRSTAHQVPARSGESGSGCVEQNSPSSFSNANFRHHHKYHGCPDHRHREMEARGVCVTGGSHIHQCSCRRPLQGSRCDLHHGRSGIWEFERNAPLAKHGFTKTVVTWSWPAVLQRYWGTVHPIGHVEQRYLVISRLSGWWGTQLSSKNIGGHCITVFLAASNSVHMGMGSRSQPLPPCQVFQPTPIWLAATSNNFGDMGFKG